MTELSIADRLERAWLRACPEREELGSGTIAERAGQLGKARAFAKFAKEHPEWIERQVKPGGGEQFFYQLTAQGVAERDKRRDGETPLERWGLSHAPPGWPDE